MNSWMKAGIGFLVLPALVLLVGMLIPGSATVTGTGRQVSMRLDSEKHVVNFDTPTTFTITTGDKTTTYSNNVEVFFDVADDEVTFTAVTPTEFRVQNRNDQQRAEDSATASFGIYAQIGGTCFLLGIGMFLWGLFQGGGNEITAKAGADFESQLVELGKQDAHTYFWDTILGRVAIGLSVVGIVGIGVWIVFVESDVVTVLIP